MTIFKKAASRGLTKSSDRSRLRDRAGALVHYIWRAEIQDLVSAGMLTAVDSYHTELLRYVRRDNGTEEVAATLVKNVLCRSADGISEEIACLLEAAGGGDGLVEHFIVSLRAGEEILDHFEDAADILLEGLGLGNCPAVGAVHLDTDNPHFHLMVTRIDVTTGEPVPLPRYDLLRGHQLLACMEDRFGWRSEGDSRWEVREGRVIGDNGAIDLGLAHDPQNWPDENFSRRKRPAEQTRLEAESLGPSGVDIVRTIVPGLTERHNELEGFLSALGSNGIDLAMTGSNASYKISYMDETGRVAHEKVRPSVLRKWSTGKLKERYGQLPDTFAARIIEPRQVSRNQIDRILFASEKAIFREQVNKISSALRQSSGTSNTDQISSARASCIFPSFEMWMTGARPNDPTAFLASSIGAQVVTPTVNPAPGKLITVMNDTHFRGHRFGRKVIYTARKPLASTTRVTDCGDVVVITGPPSDAAIRLSLKLLQQRGYSEAIASGFKRPDYVRFCKIASQMGITVAAPKKARILRKPFEAPPLSTNAALKTESSESSAIDSKYKSGANSATIGEQKSEATKSPDVIDKAIRESVSDKADGVHQGPRFIPPPPGFDMGR